MREGSEVYSQAAEIVELILDHGKLRPPEIVSHLSIYDSIKGKHAMHFLFLVCSFG